MEKQSKTDGWPGKVFPCAKNKTGFIYFMRFYFDWIVWWDYYTDVESYEQVLSKRISKGLIWNTTDVLCIFFRLVMHELYLYYAVLVGFLLSRVPLFLPSDLLSQFTLSS